MSHVKRTFSPWSLATVALALPVWLMVFHGSVMSRGTDGGIFLSVSDGVSSGLKLYDQIWENHDPFFFAAMSGAGRLNSSLPFYMDLIWIALASVGVWLLARTVLSQDRALFLSLIVSPFLLTGPVYSAGWSNTPGTALTLLAWGLFCHNGRIRTTSILSGIVLGLLAFIKLTLFPVAILGILMLLILGVYRMRVLRTAVATCATLVTSIVILNLLGWFSGYLEMLTRNQNMRVMSSGISALKTHGVGTWRSSILSWVCGSKLQWC